MPHDLPIKQQIITYFLYTLNSWESIPCNHCFTYCPPKHQNYFNSELKTYSSYIEKEIEAETIFTQNLLVNFTNNYKELSSNTLNQTLN